MTRGYKLIYRSPEEVAGDDMPRKMTEFEHAMSMSDLGRYVDKWIAIVDGSVVAEGKNGVKVFKEAKQKHPTRTPFLMKVASNRVMLL